MLHLQHRQALPFALFIALVVPLVGCGSADPDAFDDDAPGVSPQLVIATGPPGTTEVIPVPRGSRWHYDASGADLGTAWRESPTRSDGTDAWPEAAGPLGYGETYLATTLPHGKDPANRPTTTYFRRFFRGVYGAQKMYLRVMYDDGFVFYINGREGGRASMPAGPVAHGTLAAGHEAGQRYVTFDVSAQLANVRPGDHYNTLAFEVHQASSSSSDLVFDAELLIWHDGGFIVEQGLEIPRGATWQFWDCGGDLGTAWRAGDYDTTGWSGGPGPLGFGEDYLATELHGGTMTTYFRSELVVDGTFRGLTGEVMFDDGFVVYVNGTEAARASMPAGAVNASTPAFGHEASNAYRTFDWSSAVPLLVEGTNTIAVEVHQNATTSSDLVFDLALRVVRAWNLQRDRAAETLTGIWFVDASRGFAVGGAGTLVHTRDGGASWQAQESGTTANLNAVQFVDATHGWIVGAAGTVLATTDGGTTWVRQSTGTATTFSGLSFTSATHGWLIGYDPYGVQPAGAFRTTDGGATWTPVTVPAGSFEDIAFVDEQRGWIVGGISFEGDDRGAIFGTSDGGLTWTRQWVAPNHNHRLYDVEPIDATTAWAVGQRSSSGVGEILLVTRDAGATWQQLPETGGVGLHAIDFVDASHGWATGVFGSIIHTEDGGLTWTMQEKSVSYFKPWHLDVHFVSRELGWTAGAFFGIDDDRGTVMHTTTGGR